MVRHVDTDLAANSVVQQMIPPWIQKMRDVAMKLVKQEDIEAIVQSQIDAAKKGDKSAIRFVFEQLLAGGGLKGATFVQNNYGSDFGDSHAQPTPARPGTAEKLSVMQQRVTKGQSVAQPGDALVPAWECVNCGHVTTAKPERCSKCGRFSFDPVTSASV